MQRIRHAHFHVYLYETGYEVEVSLFDKDEVIRRESYERLTWREATTLLDAAIDTYRPGCELLAGGIQESLF